MITAIRLQHFRSYTDDSFELSAGVNIIVGANASGKTNLLEAVLVNCLGGSYRAKDTEMLAHNAPWARVDAVTQEGTRTVKFEPHQLGVKKTYEINNQKLQRLSLQKTIPVVLFEPNHLLILTGSPDLRREYIDTLLEQSVPGFGLLRKQYRRALAQRNALLKHGSATTQLFAWNIRLSELGGQIARERIALVSQLNQTIQELYRSLAHAPGATVAVHYQTACVAAQYSSDLLHKLEAHTTKDIERGFTSYGPHRDDLSIVLNGHPALLSASRGETRTLLLTLKIVELHILEQARGKKPLLLLDDVFSELDGARRHALTTYLERYQTFLTTTDADIVLKHFTESSNIIPITRA